MSNGLGSLFDKGKESIDKAYEEQWGMSYQEWVKKIGNREKALKERRDRQALERKDVQTQELKSLPSISNVGASAFTGTVNWNAIPSGFQPLPSTVGQNKKLYQLSQFHGGINQKSSPRDIAENECQEATNVTFSSIGTIKLLGDCLNENNTLKEFPSFTAARAPLPGYGLFEFTAPADWDGGNTGEYQILLTSEGDEIDALDHAGGHANWFEFGGSGNTDTDVAPVFYAGGNGVYICDSNFDNANSRKANIYVSRIDAGSSQEVSGWKDGKALIDSPTYDISAHGSMAAGDVKIEDAAEGSFPSVAGTMMAVCAPTGTAGSGDGTWGLEGATTYYFYISWLFDGGVETGLTSCSTDDGSGNADGIAFNKQKLGLDISLKHTPHASDNTELGGNKRIEGGRIYFKEAGTTERFLLAEFNLIDGVKGALDSTFSPWTEASDVYTHTTITFENPPSVYTYSALNGYYANEVYEPSADINADDATGPAAHEVKYKTAVVGQQGIVFIGNVKFQGKHMPDVMMYSMKNKPAVFPKYNFIDSPSSDGSPITALAAFQDAILQFKTNGLYIFNISKGGDSAYVEAAYRDCGVYNPCQVFTASFGVIFANKHGCFLYDGEKVSSLTGGRFDTSDWGLSESTSNTSSGNVPSVGYDPRSQNIIVLKNIGDDAANENTTTLGSGAWIFNMQTGSWSESDAAITNADGTRHSNFIVTNDGYLSVKSSGDATLLNYNQGQASGDAQTVTYITKDIDFGFPNHTKRIFKILLTYQGDANSLSGTCGLNGDSSPDTAMTNSVTSDATLTNHGVADYKIASFTLDSNPKTIKSIAFKFTGSCGEDFEINDISILYRLRPIK